MNFNLSSIRTKVTLALLFVSLFSIITVGLISRGIMLDRFNTLVVEQAAQGFISEVAEYYRTYGSWERARSTESFFDFVRRTRPEFFNRPVPPNQPPPDRPEVGDAPGGARYFAFGGQPPPFVVTDNFGKVILALAPDAQEGELVDQGQMDKAIPIVLDNRQIGLAVPEQRFEISPLEARYLSVFQSSWLISLILACVVALALGWYFGHRLTHPIIQLKWSMDAMRNGELKQELKVQSSDELGRLTEMFNDMSKKLDQSYKELEASNRLLSQYSNWLAAESKKKK